MVRGAREEIRPLVTSRWGDCTRAGLRRRWGVGLTIKTSLNQAVIGRSELNPQRPFLNSNFEQCHDFRRRALPHLLSLC